MNHTPATTNHERTPASQHQRGNTGVSARLADARRQRSGTLTA